MLIQKVGQKESMYQEDNAYIAGGGNGLVIVDVNDVRNPKIISNMIWMIFYDLTAF